MYDVGWLGLVAIAALLVLVGAIVLRLGLRRVDDRVVSPKHSVYGPVVFGVVGAAAGVAAAMLFRYDEARDRVYIEYSLPLVIGGTFLGATFGRLVARLHKRYPAARPWVEVTATAFLLAGPGAVLGWLFGDKREGNPPAEMSWGLLGGLVLGAGLGGISFARTRAGASAAPPTIRGLRVLAYSPIDGRHRFTGANERRSVDVTGAEVLFGPVAVLAICEETGGQGAILFGCDRDLRPIWETACATVEAARSQAEFEYEGVSQSWISVTQ